MITRENITALRMERQYFTVPVAERNYNSLFCSLSPVPTVYWCEPGAPPTLPLHVDFDDYEYNSLRRSRRDILKGRFAGGSIAYVTKEDLEVFACLYRKDINSYTMIQVGLMDLLEREGPMNIGLMKEFTGLKVKDITPALHRLQEAFLVFEDQADNEGDRSWYLFDREFPEIDLSRYSKAEALQLIIPRLADMLVGFHDTMLKSYYKVPGKVIKEALAELKKNKVLSEIQVDNETLYMTLADVELLSSKEFTIKPSVFLLQRNDFLVRANSEELKLKFNSAWDTLYYILIDGEFYGAVMGRFKFGPHIIEDIVLNISEEELKNRLDEILEAVAVVFDPVGSPIRRINGIDWKSEE